MSGRFVAARTIRPPPASKPSISTSSWLSVCSRSSLPCPTPAPRLRPTASSSSMKTIAGAALARLGEQVADAGRADADERLDELRAGDREERGVGLAGGRARQQRLAGAGRPDEQRALRRAGAERAVAVRGSAADRTAPRARRRRRARPRRRRTTARPGCRGRAWSAGRAQRLNAAHPARVGLLADAHEEREQRGEDQDRQQHLHDQALGLLAALRVDHDDAPLRSSVVSSWSCERPVGRVARPDVLAGAVGDRGCDGRSPAGGRGGRCPPRPSAGRSCTAPRSPGCAAAWSRASRGTR